MNFYTVPSASMMSAMGLSVGHFKYLSSEHPESETHQNESLGWVQGSGGLRSSTSESET